MTQPIQVITRALQAVGANEFGEPVDSDTANNCFDMLNDMLDYWSMQKMMVFCEQEVIHELTSGKYVYTIGQPGGDVSSTFTGSISGTTLTVTALSAGAISVGQLLVGSLVTPGTAITSLVTGRGGNGVDALGTYNVQISQTAASGAIIGKSPRPIRINSAFVRVITSPNGPLDYPVAILNVEEYELIGLKALSGPWPRMLYYQPSMPIGILNYWPNPSQGEMHLFCDTLFNQFLTINDTITFPPGYEMAMRWNLAELLMPLFPGTANAAEIRALIPKYAADGRALIKRTNMIPQQAAQFDAVLNAGRRNDASFIMDGGFR